MLAYNLELILTILFIIVPLVNDQNPLVMSLINVWWYMLVINKLNNKFNKPLKLMYIN